MEDLTGQTYTAEAGQFEGQTITVVGPQHSITPDRWEVRAETGLTWGTQGQWIRERIVKQNGGRHGTKNQTA